MTQVTTIGILGGGQLGRMLALAGYPLGLRFRFLEPDKSAPAGHLAEHIAEGYTDFEVLSRFAAGLEVVTYEFENVDLEAAAFLDARCPLYPPAEALRRSQDRVVEKQFLADCGVPTAPFVAIDGMDDLDRAIYIVDLPAVLKTRRLGYDGKGQFVVRDRAATVTAAEAMGWRDLILEGFVGFRRELSLVCVRSKDGSVAFYPLVENHHRDGILRLTLAPAPGLTDQLQTVAETYARSVMNALQYVGVLTIEFFETDEGLIANEMAPRVHNSGHWTIEGAETSQFENHLRAVAGLPLGSTAMLGVSAMVNLIGEAPPSHSVLNVAGAHLHLYGKSPRPGRKIGHVTVRADSIEERSKAIESLALPV